MENPALVRRCTIVMIEPSHSVDLDVGGLLQGGSPLQRVRRWFAHAPHLREKVELGDEALRVLGQMDEVEWVSFDVLRALYTDEALGDLVRLGLLIGNHDAHEELRTRDAALREQYWHPLSAAAHYCTRWDRVGENEPILLTRFKSIEELVGKHGTMPPHQIERAAEASRIVLPPPPKTAIDLVLERRVTCRNFDNAQTLGIDVVSAMLKRMVGALAETELVPDAWVFKKCHPSGGGLHPIEGYVLLRRADGAATGLYHYHAGRHALEPIRALTNEEADRAALSFVAEQQFFADAQVLVVLVARFRRTYWKYRHHSKAYRAILLEAGHISQNMYLAAAELGLGAWITAAINEVQLEEAFELDGIAQSPVAVCGFGVRARELHMYEYDPLHAVWPSDIC